MPETGDRHEARTDRVAHQLRELELDRLLVEAPVDLRYLTSFTGSNGMALIGGEGSGGEGPGEHLFLTDFRYRTQSADQVPAVFQREIVAGELLDAAAAALNGSGGRLGFDESVLTVARPPATRRAAAELGAGAGRAGSSTRLRTVKERAELARIRAATQLADEALAGRWTRAWWAAPSARSRSSWRCACAAWALRPRASPRSSPPDPTARCRTPQPREQEIPRDVLVTIDWGALHEGYCSDCTSTYATGEGISQQAREVYALVLAAQQAGLAAVAAGPSGREVDAVAREIIEQGGHGEHFGHGLGHGVGMEIHEGPAALTHRRRRPLRPGNVVTVEPGVYLPGVLGVRIEDLVVVGEDAQEVLTGLPKALTVVS